MYYNLKNIFLRSRADAIPHLRQELGAHPGSGQWTDDGVGHPPASLTPGTPMSNVNSPTGPTDIPQITQTFTLNKLTFITNLTLFVTASSF